MRYITPLILGICLASCSQTAQHPRSATSLAGQQSLRAYEVSEAPTSLMTYVSKAPTIDQKYATEKANLFGISQVAIDDSKSFRGIAGDCEVRINTRTGGVEYHNVKKMWGADDRPFEGSISDDEVESIATKYIAEKKLVDLNDVEFFQVNKLTRTSNITNQTEVMSLEAVYKRKLNGRLIQGAGSQVSIFISSDRNVCGAFIDWPELTPDKEVTLRDPKDVSAEIPKLHDEMNRNFQGQVKVSGFEVKKTHLEYSGLIQADGSRLIYPAYSLEGIKRIGDRQDEDVLIVPAFDGLKPNMDYQNVYTPSEHDPGSTPKLNNN